MIQKKKNNNKTLKNQSLMIVTLSVLPVAPTSTSQSVLFLHYKW